MNIPQLWLEQLIGYHVDWDATGTWAQLIAAIIGVRIAWSISRAELIAQRAVAAEERRQFDALVLGIASDAEGAIELAAAVFSDRETIAAIGYGDVAIPSTAGHVNLLKEIDLNRVSTAKTALALAELRRKCGWSKRYKNLSLASYRANGEIDPDLVIALRSWRLGARRCLDTIRAEMGMPPLAAVD